VAVFRDPRALTVEDPAHDEQRFVTIGMVAFGRILVVAYSCREPETIRIVSVDKAHASELNQYQS
jgi:uncharacterized DUF497 family protein